MSEPLKLDPLSLQRLVDGYEAPGFMHQALHATRAPVERVAPDPPTPRSLDAARRVAAAYRRARADGVASGLSMWNYIEQRHAAFIKALEDVDERAVQAHLGAMFAGDLVFGIARLDLSEHPEPTMALRCADTLRSLAEACGAARVVSAEQQGANALRQALQLDLDALLAAIERVTGLDLACVALAGTHGCRIGGTLVNIDSVVHSYSVYRLRELGATAASAIVEIGGGYGCLAELAARAGMTRYTIYDLPWVNALQGYFLIMARPDTVVRLYGEDHGTLAVMPFWRIRDLPAQSIDYAVNVNSLPEIDAGIAREYIGVIARVARRGFLSLNQESMVPVVGPQHWVHDLARTDGRLACVSRYRWWMEQGYVEEFYVPRRAR